MTCRYAGLAFWSINGVHSCPSCLDERRERQQIIIDHNREMLKLRVTGQAYRDRLVRERLRLRAEQ